MNRRNFLKRTSLVTGSALLLHNNPLLANSFKGKSIDKLGVQLFSVRQSLGSDPKSFLKQLAQMGYTQFESFSGKDGFLWGLSPKEMKSYLKDIGAEMISTHFNYSSLISKPEELKKELDKAAEAGLKYILCPYIGAQKTFDDWKRIADHFNQTGELANKLGLKFGYHNHDYSFKPLEGKLPQEYLLENTDPKKVMFELDLCWIDVAGVNTEQHLKKYGKRYELCHIKDYTKIDGKPVQNDLGKGAVNIASTLKKCLESGIKYYIVEQEQYPVSPMESLKNNVQFMKDLKL